MVKDKETVQKKREGWYEHYDKNAVSQVDATCIMSVEEQVRRILRGERIRGRRNLVYDTENIETQPIAENPARRRGYDFADADADLEDINDRISERKKNVVKNQAQEKEKKKHIEKGTEKETEKTSDSE